MFISFQAVYKVTILHIAFLYSWTDRKKLLNHKCILAEEENNQ